MAYGTVPVVRETGGLKDTVTPYNEYSGEGNGFSFANINAHELLFVTKYAADIYRHKKDVWNHIIETGMKGDYSWKKSAAEYAGLFSLICGIELKPAEDKAPAKEEKKAEEPKQPAKKAAAPKAASPKKKPAAKKAPAAKKTEKKQEKKPADKPEDNKG
jgi:starch synthase